MLARLYINFGRDKDICRWIVTIDDLNW